MIRMKFYVFPLVVISLVRAQSSEDRNKSITDLFPRNPGPAIPPGFEIVPGKNTLGDYGALERCGEGTQRGLKVCIPYHRCDPATNTVTEEAKPTFGAGVIDIRAGVNECESYLDVCCNLPSGGTGSTTSLPPTRPTEPTPPKESFCGIRNTQGIDFKITGNTNEAEYAEFPWMVAILKTNYDPAVDESLSICGGSIIAPSVVLTGAHCVYKFKTTDLKVRAGEWDTQTTKERLPYQERAVQEIITHPNFHQETLFNDVALLILETPVDKADNIGTVCLPPQGQQFFSENCFASGWGKKEFGAQGVYSVILKKIELPIVQRPQCQDDLRKTRLGKFFELHQSFICAGGEQGKDTCTGDGGGPLVCPDPQNPGRYQQAGIVAWGIGCGDVKVPGVYADVSSFREWIDAQMRRLNLDTKPYFV